MAEEQQASPDPHSAVSALMQEVITGDVDERAPANQDTSTGDTRDQVKLDDKPPEGDTLDDVTALLADKEPEPDADRDEDKPRGKVESLADLAEQLGVKPEEIYKLKIPMREDGTVLTLGELKDQAGKALDLDDVSAEINERRTTFENDMIRSKQELADIVSLLPEVPPSLIEKARAAHFDTVERERNALLDILPEWKDDQKYAAARGEMLEAVADYGFTAADLDLVIDHRLSKLIWDFTGYKKRIDAANAKAKEIRESAPKGGKRVSAAKQRTKSREAAAERAKSGTTGDQVREVGNILLGKS